MQTKYLCVLIHIWIKSEVGAPLNLLSPPVKFYWPFQGGTSFVDLLCFCSAMSLSASVYMCFVVTCWERADLFALVCCVCSEFVTFPLVCLVRCGTWLYRFLIFAPLLTLLKKKMFYIVLCLQMKIQDTMNNRHKTNIITQDKDSFTIQKQWHFPIAKLLESKAHNYKLKALTKRLHT